MEKNNCYIIFHQGYGDLFNSIGFVNFYLTIYNNITIFVLDENRKIIMDNIFENNKKVKTIIPIFNNNVDNINTCILCMTKGNKNNCPRFNNLQCKFIDYNSYNAHHIIKIGSFNNFDDWILFYSKSFSFAHAFYLYNNLNDDIRIKYFKIFNNKEKENEKYNDFINKNGINYILIHEDTKRNLLIDKNKIINKNLKIINLDNLSNNFVDFIKIIENSKEIHLIDSSWSVFIYLLSHTNELIKNIKIFLNESLAKYLKRDYNIYKNPTYDNWVFY